MLALEVSVRKDVRVQVSLRVQLVLWCNGLAYAPSKGLIQVRILLGLQIINVNQWDRMYNLFT